MTAFPVRFTSTNAPPPAVEADWLVMCVPQGSSAGSRVDSIDQQLGGQLARLREAGDLTGKAMEILPVYSPAGLRARRLLLIGLGPADRVSRASIHDAFAAAMRTITGRKFGRVALVL